MHGLLSTALLCISAALAGATTVAEDGKTFHIWMDYSRCDTPDALKLQISDFNAPSSDPDPEPTHQPTGEYLLSLTGPFHGSVTLLQPDRMGPYRQQYLDLRLYAAADAGPDGVLGNATFVPGAEVRNWDGVKWGSVEKGLYPDGGLEATGVVDGVAGTTVTRKAGDGLFLEWCTKKVEEA